MVRYSSRYNVLGTDNNCPHLGPCWWNKWDRPNLNILFTWLLASPRNSSRSNYCSFHNNCDIPAWWHYSPGWVYDGFIALLAGRFRAASWLLQKLRRHARAMSAMPGGATLDLDPKFVDPSENWYRILERFLNFSFNCSDDEILITFNIVSIT